MRLLELKQKTQCAAIRAAACGEFPTLATLQTALDSRERNEAPSNAMRSKRLKTSTAFCLHKNTSGSRFFLNDSSCNNSFKKNVQEYWQIFTQQYMVHRCFPSDLPYLTRPNLLTSMCLYFILLSIIAFVATCCYMLLYNAIYCYCVPHLLHPGHWWSIPF